MATRIAVISINLKRVGLLALPTIGLYVLNAWLLELEFAKWAAVQVLLFLTQWVSLNIGFYDGFHRAEKIGRNIFMHIAKLAKGTGILEEALKEMEKENETA